MKKLSSHIIQNGHYYYIYFLNFLLDFRFWGTWAEHVRQLRRNTHGSVLFFPSPLYPHLAFIPMLSLPKFPTPTVPPQLPYTPVSDAPLPVSIVQHPHMSENMQCLIFCSCVSLLRMMVFRFIHVPTKDTNSSYFMTA